ncbi:MAG: phage terminase large subunit family protein [Phycisphaeraceae bacterium]|nr:phage terminase large subunit family protein [Phycisphaeraceae bacterium]
MAIDIRQLTPTELIRLVNSTSFGAVLNAPRLNRQMNEAGYRITAPGSDGRKISLVKYVGWLAKQRERPRRSAISYEERKRREAERNLAKSRAGRDIGDPPPPPTEGIKRRALCERNFRSFCETYFPAAFSLPWSDDHLRIMAKIERAVLQGGLFAFAMPRGSGKTTLARVAGLWAVLYGHREYVCLIGSAEDQAKSMLDAIKREMLANDRLLADFPEAIYPIRKLENNARRQIGQLSNGEPTYIIWSADRVVMPTMPESPSSGGIITVAGLDSNIRGQQHTKMDGTIVRPSLVILDDPQTRQSAGSVTQTRHRLAILNGDVLGMGGPGVKMAGFMTCTKIYHDDLADQILDRERNPDWQGECTKMVYSFPTSAEAEKLWDRYAQVRAQSLRNDGDGSEATTFYRKHRTAMDAGAVVAWPQRHNKDEISALQHAMNLKLRDEEAFLAEYQNEPLTEQADDEILTPDQVAERFNGRPRKWIPAAAAYITAFIDVHDRLLYYLVAAWELDFTGYVIDYGTWPDQKRLHFTMRDAKRTLGMQWPGAGVEGAVQGGLEQLVGELLSRPWKQNEGIARIDRLLIDAGYLPGVVANVCLKTPGAGNAITMPSKGVGIRAGNRPMSAYHRKPGERHGHHWYVPNVSRTTEIRHAQFDTNYWKSFVHARLATSPGDRGSLTLFGRSANEHRLFADHIAGSEVSTMTEGHGRSVREWSLRPSRPDNHWFDCLVGTAVAASMCGTRLGVEPVTEQPARHRVRLSELQARRR